MEKNGVTNSEVVKRLAEVGAMLRLGSKGQYEKFTNRRFEMDLEEVRWSVTNGLARSAFRQMTGQGGVYRASDRGDSKQGQGVANTAELLHISKLPVFKSDAKLGMVVGKIVCKPNELHLDDFTLYDTLEQINSWPAVKEGTETMVAMMCHFYGPHIYEQFGQKMIDMANNRLFGNLTSGCPLYMSTAVMMVLSNFLNNFRQPYRGKDNQIMRLKDGGWVKMLDIELEEIMADVYSVGHFERHMLADAISDINVRHPKKKVAAAEVEVAADKAALKALTKHIESLTVTKRGREADGGDDNAAGKKVKQSDGSAQPLIRAKSKKPCIRELSELLGLPKSVVEHCPQRQRPEACTFSHDLSQFTKDQLIEEVKENPASAFTKVAGSKERMIAALRGSSLFD